MIEPANAASYSADAVAPILREANLLREAIERPPSLRNSIVAADLGGSRRLRFRLQVYDVPPVPYKQGVLLSKIYRELLQAIVDVRSGDISDEHGQDRGRRLAERAVAVFRKLVRPHTRLHRLLWPILSNPFEVASDQEVWQLMGFFLDCRKISGVSPLPTEARPLPTRTL